MPKLDIEFELTGLKLKIKGDSDDVSSKVADLQRQIQGLMGTINNLTQQAINPELLVASPATHKTIDAGVQQDGSGTRRKTGTRKSSGASKPKADAIDFKHDAEEYGFPKQEWSTAQKAMWLLYMLTNDGTTSEMTASVIAATFNKHFKSFKTILAHNVARDLAKEKGKSGAVNSDATKNPETWHLLEAGKKQVAAFIAQAKGTATE